ncbi:DUF4272 domain-containing protein [Collimonas pratensis]|uniref:DUF4272 domain-containing protein n=1 Tax=Collimonas pratensis TaxID=279113 RepID=A0A127Q1D6_9BURK|nr:DUF4272 domain-containing protein [Collimonas pratensis]AMP03900.1 hypothetical protein CPter91_1522 [Collimonas pratensis]
MDEIFEEDAQKPRSAKDVAERLLALMAITSRAFEDVAEQSLSWVKENKIDLYFSSEEKSFYFSQIKPRDKDRTNFSWRLEAAIPLIWALGGMETLPPLTESAKISDYEITNLAYDNPQKFLASVELRSNAEIEEAESEHYNQHWRVRDAQLFKKPMPVELDPSIVYERRYALSWLVGYGDDWDNVPTDT